MASRFPTSPAPAASFPSRKKPARLHPLEITLVGLSGAHLCFLPWALGTMHVWSQVLSFLLAGTCFAIALVPRTHIGEYSRDGRSYRYLPVRRLLKFPGFWLGLILLAYVFVQAVNPAWRYMREGDAWWMERIDHVAWLPASADAPFAISNPWRALLVWSSAWMTACALWIGLTRRAMLRGLLSLLVLNATLLAIVGILQHVAGNGKILWFIEPSTHYAVATFLYKNHAGAYFNLLLATALAVAAWHQRHSERHFERASPAPVFVVCAVLLALIVALSFSRASTLLMLLFGAVSIVMGVLHLLRSARRPNLPLVAAIAVCLAGLVWLSARQLQLARAADKFQQLFQSDRVASIESRQIAAQATWEMAQAQPVTGWGAGCFRFLFPLFQQNHPAIYQPAWDPGRMFYYEHAHNDYLQFLAELGIVGSLPLILLLGAGVFAWCRRRAWKNSPALLLSLGLALLLAHCWIDFHLQNPAILLTASALAVVLVRWIDLESKRRNP